ncbi:MAG: Gram-negative bacterial tonB protein [Hydrocarboniphaga sp.]|uniref:energy transducer TonB n=1 Tax=Hydrocarboniphaga sp. TaxID=2033016 RepID=UPI002620D425|nr:energy transducer TonB [Hydrocarboniphaga sp.]MDB5971522.1 Gram-negative bacterial tonB protein [Hydrocarboniphaga sp.]
MEFGKRQDPKRRVIGITGVVIFHILLVYGLVNGLARKAIELLPPPIETKILDEVKTDEEPPPPPPPPKLDVPPPPFIPPPEISIASAPAPKNAITSSTKPAPPAPPKPAGVSKAPVVKAKLCREPDYPAVSERLGETGTVLLQLLVDVDGKVSDSKIQASSGFERLDKAAQQALSRCKFEPGTVNGAPAPAWAQLKYTFRKQK